MASCEEQPDPGLALRWTVVPVLSSLIIHLYVVIEAPSVTPTPPSARGSVRAALTASLIVLVWATAAGATVWAGLAVRAA